VSLILGVLHTFFDLLIIAFCIGVGLLIFVLIRAALSVIEPPRIRTLKRFAKTEGFSIERLAMGMWDALDWSVTFKRDQSFLGKPENGIRHQFHLPDFPESLRGGIIAFPKSSKEIISQRFHNTFPDDLYDAVLFVIESLSKTVGRNQRKGKAFLAYGSAQAMSFGLLLHRDWMDYLTKEVFDEDCFCLDIAGVNSEFLFLLTAKLLEAFGQQAAVLKVDDLGGIWVVRRILNNKAKEHR
jgi:hypothetical protein